MLFRYGLVASAFGALLLFSTHSQANDGADEAVDEIIVTGSRLPRRDYSAPSPIASIDEDALRFSGQPTLEEALNKMPQVSPDFGRTSNNPGDGTSTVNLRGLGAERTLVLLNGRRVAPSGVGSAVDVNNLPQALMQRVEIITGGATTVYGADAVAGVVNFITRDDFDGFGVDASTYVTEQGDANINDITVTWGHNFASGRGNVTLFGGYYDREELFSGDRDLTSIVLFDNWDGTIQEGGSSTVPEGIIFAPRYDFGDGVPARITFEPDGTPRPYDELVDFYNYAPGNYLQIPLERKSFGAMANYDLSGGIEWYLEAAITFNDATQNLAPIPAFGFFAINLDSPFFTPEMQQIAASTFFPLGPGIGGAVIGRRMVELGPRTVFNEREYNRLVTGFRGEINETWDFDAWFSWTDATESEYLLNGASFSRWQQGMLVDPVSGQCFDPTDGCVPVNVFGAGNLSPEAIEFIRTDPFFNRTTREQALYSAYIRGAPIDSWAGPINMAFGVEYRSDKGFFVADQGLFTGDALGYNGVAGVDGEEDVLEAYTEAAIPLAEGTAWAEYLGLEIGARRSDYENAGGVTTWKIGGEWQLPIPLRFRTMAQRSVRAPNLEEAFTEQRTSIGSFTGNNNDFDPCSAVNDPIGIGIVDACIATGVPASEIGTWTATLGFPTENISGGNPNLKPESADTFTFGVILDLDVLQGLQISVDYFDLEMEDTIGFLDVGIACYDPVNTEQAFCENIERDPLTYNVERVTATTINRGLFEVSGIDTQVNLESDLPFADANLAVSLMWTHTFENNYQETSFGTIFECAGRFGWPCNFARFTNVFPTNRVNTNLTFYSGDFTARLAHQWIEGTDNGLLYYGEFFGLEPDDLGLKYISDRHYFDLGLGYRFNEYIAANLTVSNLLDEDAPLFAGYAFSTNTDSTVYDVFGRAYTLSLALRF